MSRSREPLPQLGGGLFLCDGGIETTLVFHEGLDLPDFAAFALLRTEPGTEALRRYFRTYAAIAERFRTGLVLESATWRASADWGARLGFSTEELAEANRRAVELLVELRSEFETVPLVVSGCLGPRGDGYVPDRAMSEQDAERYHHEQMATFAATDVDLVSAMTMNTVEEATGIVRAAEQFGLPIAVSFTVETDGHLPTGQSLASAIERVDAATSGYPAYYMINCAHPTHFESQWNGGAWQERIRGVRANASRQSHAELNESPVLDEGNPVEFGEQYAALRQRLPQLNVLGGCCGTDHRHVEQVARCCTPRFGTSS